jgi:glutamate--cysteine ligase
VSLSEAMLLDDVRQRLFSPTRSRNPYAIGLELELIPVHQSTRAPALAAKDGQTSTAEILSQLGRRESWLEESADGDPPSWTLKDGSRISFEPGGQIEISTAPQPTASVVIDSTQNLVALLREEMSNAGIELVARGVDPYNNIDAVPLQLHRDRYTGMTRYFNSIGPSGVRMMRQTAALQINLERGEDPKSRWRLLNALAPIVVALFANSRQYAGKPTEWASYRAQLWRTLDSSRTGIAYDEAAHAPRYLAFALNAFAIRSGRDGPGYRTFREWMNDPAVNMDDWLFHLSTLFPEVRPKEFFELRSADTIEPDTLAAPVLFITGLVYDEESAHHAIELTGAPSEKLLQRAGRLGLADPAIRRIASQLVVLALDGARRLGNDYLRRSHLASAYQYFARALSTTETDATH